MLMQTIPNAGFAGKTGFIFRPPALCFCKTKNQTVVSSKTARMFLCLLHFHVLIPCFAIQPTQHPSTLPTFKLLHFISHITRVLLSIMFLFKLYKTMVRDKLTLTDILMRYLKTNTVAFFDFFPISNPLSYIIFFNK